jgi:hypothetical protein
MAKNASREANGVINSDVTRVHFGASEGPAGRGPATRRSMLMDLPSQTGRTPAAGIACRGPNHAENPLKEAENGISLQASGFRIRGATFREAAAEPGLCQKER